MNSTGYWVIGLAVGLFTAAMLIRTLLERMGVRDRIRPSALVIVAWASVSVSAVAVVVAVINGSSSLGRTTATLVVTATVALLLHRRLRATAPQTPIADDDHRDMN
jgi:hypothetical protein